MPRSRRQRIGQVGQIRLAQQVNLLSEDPLEYLGNCFVRDIHDRRRAVCSFAHERHVDDPDGAAGLKVRQRRRHITADLTTLERDHGHVDRTDRVRFKHYRHLT
jgi:hypothetical protein